MQIKWITFRPKRESLLFLLSVWSMILLSGCNNNIAPSEKTSPIQLPSSSPTSALIQSSPTPLDLATPASVVEEKSDLGVDVEYENDAVKKAMQDLDHESMQNMPQSMSNLGDFSLKKNDEVIVRSAVTGNILSSEHTDIVLVVSHGFLYPELEKVATLVMTKSGEHYTVAYAKDALGNVKISLHDIDSDNKNEVFIENTSFYKGPYHTLTVLRQGKEGNLNQIFHVNCTYNELHSSYDSKFDYILAPNKINVALTDIVLNLQSEPKELDKDYINHDNITPVKPLKDQIIFKFDGTKFVPNKDTNGYIYFIF